MDLLEFIYSLYAPSPPQTRIICDQYKKGPKSSDLGPLNSEILRCAQNDKRLLSAFDQSVYDVRIRKRRCIAQAVELIFGDLAQDAAHDLA